MDDTVVIQLSANWRVMADNLQWIIQTRRPINSQPDKWRAVSFIGSDKKILARCLREYGAVINKRGQAKLDRLPDTFLKWRNA